MQCSARMQRALGGASSEELTLRGVLKPQQPTRPAPALLASQQRISTVCLDGAQCVTNERAAIPSAVDRAHPAMGQHGRLETAARRVLVRVTRRLLAAGGWRQLNVPPSLPHSPCLTRHALPHEAQCVTNERAAVPSAVDRAHPARGSTDAWRQPPVGCWRRAAAAEWRRATVWRTMGRNRADRNAASGHCR